MQIPFPANGAQMSAKSVSKLHKTGPKEQQIGKNADYQITVTNPGDKPLTEVVVTDVAPNATSIVSANGATVNGNQAVWRLKELKPGEKVTFNLTLTTCTPGCFTNRVNVTDCQGCMLVQSSQHVGKDVLLLTSRSATQKIQSALAKQQATASQLSTKVLNLTAMLLLPSTSPKKLYRLAATGDTQGTVSGQTVTFAPVQQSGPRSTLKYRVDAKGCSFRRCTYHCKCDYLIRLRHRSRNKKARSLTNRVYNPLSSKGRHCYSACPFFFLMTILTTDTEKEQDKQDRKRQDK